MKNILILITIILLTSPILVLANNHDFGLNALESNLPRKNLIDIVANIINVVLSLLGLIAVCLLVYGGFIWMTSAGNAEQIEKAKKLLVAALIGLLIILLAYSIVSFVIGKLLEATDPSFGNGSGSGSGSGGVGGSGNVFYVEGFSPINNASNIIRNATVRIIFNYNLSASTLSGNVKIHKQSDTAQEEAPVSFIIANDKIIELTPNTACPSPNETLKCFDANTQFKITVNDTDTGIKDNSGKKLTCSFKYPCVSVFTTGALIDVKDPNITVLEPYNNQSIPIDFITPLKARAEDDSGISYAYFIIDGTSTEFIPSTNSDKAFIAEDSWNTTGLELKSWHKISAKAYDLDQHSAESAINNVQILAAHCFNEIKDFDETNSDCGGNDCRACDGTSCKNNNECAGNLCLNNQCATMPIISGISPEDGAVKNYVTIFGSGFGSSGVVTFLGRDGSGDDKAAFVPQVCKSGFSDKQIIVEVPDGAVSGPVSVKNNSNNLIDVTNDANGPLVNDFTVNEIKRPGLCSISPGRGEAFTAAALTGIQFGNDTQEKKIFFGSITSPIASWSNTSIQTNVPNVQPQNVIVYIVANNEKSNGVVFTVEQSKVVPKIDYIDPVAGPKGEYITIVGSNFGTSVGSVYFQGSAGENVLADTNFPEQCGTIFWRDDYVIVKVPNNVANASAIKLQTSRGQESNKVDFNINNSALKPAICRIDPDNGPIGLEVNIYGERFQSFETDKSLVRFYNTVSAIPQASNWTETSIKSKVPILAQTGPLKVIDKKGSLSNPVNFKVGSCASKDQCENGFECCSDGSCRVAGKCATLPGSGQYSWSFTTGDLALRVIEECSATTIPSPSPWNNRDKGANVCVNAIISARFAPSVNLNTINTNNIIIKQCNTGNIFDEEKCSNILAGVLSSLTPDNTQSGFKFIPDNSLIPNTWYNIELTQNIQTIKGSSFITPYKWQFKTRDGTEICKVGSVEISPNPYTAKHKNETIKYTGDARAADDQCVLINAKNYTWSWSSDKTNFAIIDDTLTDTANATALKETKSNNPVVIKGKIAGENKEDTADLIIQFKDPSIINYWPNCKTACVNAAIGAVFDTEISTATFTNNIKFYECNDTTCKQKTKQDISLSNSFDNNKEEHTVLIKDASLKANTYYSVEIVGGENGIKSTDDKELINGKLTGDTNKLFSWIFKTKDDNALCAIDRVEVSPSDTVLNIIPIAQDYKASPFGAPDSCNTTGQMLTGNYMWKWESSLGAVAVIPSDITKDKNTATSVGKGEAKISAITQDKTGDGNLEVQCGYTKDSLCPNGPELVAVGSDTCCWSRPTAEININSCINGVITIVFDQIMNFDSLKKNIKLQLKKTSQDCPDGTTKINNNDTLCDVEIKMLFTDIKDATSGIEKTKVTITPVKFLQGSSIYQLDVIGDNDLKDNKNEGVINQVFVSMPKIEPKSFLTSKDACKIDKVQMTISSKEGISEYDEFNCVWPSENICAKDIDKTKSKEQHLYTAQAIDQDKNPLQAKYEWTQCTAPLKCSPENNNNTNTRIIETDDKEYAGGFVSAFASSPDNNLSLGSATGTVEVNVFLCENKGILLRSSIYNFKTHYCRDTGVPEEPLPELKDALNSCLNTSPDGSPSGCPLTDIEAGDIDCF